MREEPADASAEPSGLGSSLMVQSEVQITALGFIATVKAGFRPWAVGSPPPTPTPDTLFSQLKGKGSEISEPPTYICLVSKSAVFSMAIQMPTPTAISHQGAQGTWQQVYARGEVCLQFWCTSQSGLCCPQAESIADPQCLFRTLQVGAIAFHDQIQNSQRK